MSYTSQGKIRFILIVREYTHKRRNPNPDCNETHTSTLPHHNLIYSYTHTELKRIQSRRSSPITLLLEK
jgi:hypothetical protein